MAVYRDYYPFGMEIPGRSYTDADGYRYGYQGQYAEKDPETEWNAFELRMYDSRVGRWLSVDPKNEFYSPYVGIGNDPVSKTDPDGGETEDNPIYDTQGFFLGTDDKGIMGDAIVMDRKNFIQGMKHEDAEKFNLGVNGLEKNFAVYNRFYTSINQLMLRPDYGGKIITREQGVNWALAHPGALDRKNPEEALYIDASSLDFGNLNYMMFARENEITPVNLLNGGNLIESIWNKRLESTIYALGRVNLILRSFETLNVNVVNDEATIYDWNRGGGWPRKSLIDRERKKFGLNDSHGFRVFYYGTGKLNR